MKILVSACLLGDNCKYNGGNNQNDELISLLKKHEVIKVCPEVMGGLSTPRLSSEIKNAKVINTDNIDVTEYFKIGAEKTLEIAKKNNIKYAILKSNSPSCGYGKIYDGSFSHTLIDGNGITADLLSKNGIIILNENNYKKYLN